MNFNTFIWQEDDIITTDKYLQFTQSIDPSGHIIKYYKRDFLFSDGIWRDKKVSSCKNFKSNIIVIGHSDNYLDNHIADKIKCETNCKYIYSVNNISSYDWCFNLPLGICNNTNESDLHKIIGNTNIMHTIFNTPKIYQSRYVYSNFNINTNKNKRQKCYNELQNIKKLNQNLIDFENYNYNLTSRSNFLSKIRNHKFVICPEGNGIDTHRLWETIYMGSIPIVQTNIAFRGFEDLPIAFINDWIDINPSWCDIKYNEIINSEWNFEKMKIGYWYNNFKNKINEFI